MDIKLCYSISDHGNNFHLIELLHSIHTIQKYFDKDDIIVFHTPPHSDRYEDMISQYATVIRKDHYQIPHPTFTDHHPAFYWDKFYSTEVDCDNLVFLDNDTEIERDIREYFDRDFDILVFGDESVDEGIWAETWGYLRSPERPCVMTTAILFKNRTHTKLKDELERIARAYIVDKTIRFPREERLFEEYVFSLATRDFDVRIVEKNTDMVWTKVDFDKAREGRTILHGGGRRLFRIGTKPDEDDTFGPDLLQRARENVHIKHWMDMAYAIFTILFEEEHPDLEITFRLEGFNRVVMDLNKQFSEEKVAWAYEFVRPYKVGEYEFVVRCDQRIVLQTGAESSKIAIMRHSSRAQRARFYTHNRFPR